MLTSVLAVIVTFGLVIFIHELGHFILCRLLKIRVETFSLGFGKALWQKQHEGTLYVVRAIPLGGYVKPAGETLDDHKGAPDEYFSHPWYERIALHLAGPAMNYLLAFVLFTAVILAVGVPGPSEETVVGEIVEDYPAYQAGMREGDKILSVDGKPLKDWMAVAEAIHSKPGVSITLGYERAGKKYEAALTPKASEGTGYVGISPLSVNKRKGVVESVKLGAYQCWYWTKYTMVTLASKIYHREKPDVAGPVGIVHMVSKAAHSGFANLVFLIGLISVAIGIFNLLPIPILDGGQSLIFLWEGISRHKPTERVFQVANAMGLAFLLCVLLFATYSDINRIFAKSAATETVKK
ncbi:MAG: RIP metalloprotease RseP [Elusimicrobiales bacterium]